MIELKIYKTHPDVNLPAFATDEAACFDIAASMLGKITYEGYNKTNSKFERKIGSDGAIAIMPGDRVMVPTGMILDIPKGYSVRLHPRSGLSLKLGLVLANCEAVIDSDYFNELFLLIHNTSENKINVAHGERLAQAELVEQITYKITETKLKPEQRTNRIGGLGSTGVKDQITDAVTQQPEKRGRGRPKKDAA